MDRRKFIASTGAAAAGAFLVNKLNAKETESKEEEKALEMFRGDFNCSQAVLSSFSQTLNFDSDLAIDISSGFGGGMGRLQDTCGAVTGSFMVLGIHNGKKHAGTRERISNTYSMVREFDGRFKSIHGATDCRSLMKCDLSTEEGRNYSKEHNLSEKVCEKCISDSVRILHALMEK